MGKLGESINPFFILRIQPRCWFLILSWTMAVVLCLVDLGADNKSFRVGTASETVQGSLGKNEIEDFRFVHYDPEKQESNYSVSFERLRSENASLGTFRTALFKVVTIEDLQLCYQQNNDLADSSNDTAAISGKGNPFFGGIDFAGGGNGEQGNYLQEQLIGQISQVGLGGDEYVELMLPDLSNAVETNIKGFKYELFSKGQLLLSVQSKRALVEHRDPEIMTLRGHVIIKVGQTTLESNRVKWDMVEQKFIVSESYLLTCNGIKTAGRGTSFDVWLNPLKQNDDLPDAGRQKKYVTKR
ncbi:MAG: hypothetical protein JXD22_03750 [Sedimentisphaerales bacterium]|nr:hypothetical protein [Sedimentisphaerales bacterium]